MKILVVGGGSGGHITPTVAVVREILALKPRTKIEFWTDRKYYKNVVKIVTELGVSWGREEKGSGQKVQYIRVKKVSSGKFRRYANWHWKDYFIYWKVTLGDLICKNIVGFFGFIGGLVQSFFRLVKKNSRPDVIFLKGGFVGLPVGLIARLLKIPYVIHESDSVLGLANRLLAKKAQIVATGVPFDDRKGEKKNWRWVGIPVAPEFKAIGEKKQESLKKIFGFEADKPLIIITGGSQGAQDINESVREILPEMLKFTSVGLVAGRKRYEEMVDLKKYEKWDKAKLQSNFRMWEFNTTMDELMGAADVVVSRAGATTIAELAALKKAVILIPFEKLANGHQVKNAERLAEKGAAISICDADMCNQPGILLEAARHLVRSPKERQNMAALLNEESKPHAAADLANILISIASDRGV